jgi:hypothetical protein
MTGAYFLSHNGLGDNLYSVGALRFLLQYYTNIYFLCKDKYHDNVRLFFADEPRIECVPFDSNDETMECFRILHPQYIGVNDVFICGYAHTRFFRSKITNANLLAYKPNDMGFDLNHDTINDTNYSFLRQFYTDINLDLNVFYTFFVLPSSETSRQLYADVKHYTTIIFLHTDSSDGKQLNIDHIVSRYNDDENSILISNNRNLYSPSDIRYALCQPFVMNKLVFYLELIRNSTQIYIIDSCMTGIVLPLLKTGQLKASVVRIIQRDMVDCVL